MRFFVLIAVIAFLVALNEAKMPERRCFAPVYCDHGDYGRPEWLQVFPPQKCHWTQSGNQTHKATKKAKPGKRISDEIKKDVEAQKARTDALSEQIQSINEKQTTRSNNLANEMNKKYEQLAADVTLNQEEQTAKNNEFNKKYEQLATNVTTNPDVDSVIANLTENLERKDKEINQLTSKISETEQQVRNLNEKNKELEIVVQRLEPLEARMDEADTRFQQKMEKLDATIKGLCGGVAYGGYCFTAIILTGNNYMNYAKAVKTCRALSSKPADILDETHYNLLFKYIRSLTTAEYKNIWLGITMNPSTKDINFSNGNQAPYVKYRAEYPKSKATFTQMVLEVNKDPNNIYQGMLNYVKTMLFHGVLCQK